MKEVKDHEHDQMKYWGTTHFDQIEEFYDFVLKKRDNILVDGYEALKTQRLIEDIYNASKK